MIEVEKHIEELDTLLKRKGYERPFMSVLYGNPGALGDTIRKHIFNCYLSNKPLDPFHVETYTKWQDQDSPYVRCDLKISYNEQKGFEVKQLNIEYNNSYGNIRKCTHTLGNNTEIPDRQKVNEIAEGQRRKDFDFNTHNMNRYILIFTIGLMTINASAQTFNEWFRQKKTQRKYLVKQIAALKVQLEYVKEGYEIARKGLTMVGDIKGDSHQMDVNYFTSLKEVKAAVGDSEKVPYILASMEDTMQELRDLKSWCRRTDAFNPGEKKYLLGICDQVIHLCGEGLEDLDVVLTSNRVEMKDDERLNRLDNLYREAVERRAFSKSFNNEAHSLALARVKEQQELSVIHANHY